MGKKEAKQVGIPQVRAAPAMQQLAAQGTL